MNQFPINYFKERIENEFLKSSLEKWQPLDLQALIDKKKLKIDNTWTLDSYEQIFYFKKEERCQELGQILYIDIDEIYNDGEIKIVKDNNDGVYKLNGYGRYYDEDSIQIGSFRKHALHGNGEKIKANG